MFIIVLQLKIIVRVVRVSHDNPRTPCVLLNTSVIIKNESKKFKKKGNNSEIARRLRRYILWPNREIVKDFNDNIGYLPRRV